MPANYLEQLAGEWYEYQDYIVRRNISVGKRQKGGYDGELDVLAFKPATNHLVHLEASMDADSWHQREVKFQKKFQAGAKHIPDLFYGLKTPPEIERIVLLEYASTRNHQMVGGGKIMLVTDFMKKIFAHLKDIDVAKRAVPENLPILRGFQFIASHCDDVWSALRGSPG